MEFNAEKEPAWFPESKIYFNGSQYIAIPHTTRRYKKRPKKIEKIFALPGNGGIAKDATCVNIGAKDIDGIVRFAKENSIDYAVVAPDDPLVLGMVVHNYPVHDSGLVVSVVYAEYVAVDSVIEGSCRDLDLFLGPSDVVPESVYLVVRHRDEVVGNEEGADADHDTRYAERNKHSLQGYSRSLDGQELVVLAQRTQRHHGRQQCRKREGEREHGDASPAEEFKYHLETQSLADQLVDIKP